MGKKLAIRGHLTRGKEIIELLEMMSGHNSSNLLGNKSDYVYFITDSGNIGCRDTNHILTDYFTLEKFLEKYPFKDGDKVFLYDNITEGYVTGMKWDEINGTVKYCVYTSAECWCDVKELLKWNAIDLEDCERFKNLIDNVKKPFVKNHKMGPKSKLPTKYYEDKMEEINSKQEYDELKMPLDNNENKFPSFELIFIMNNELEYKIPDGYEITEVSKDKVFIKKIKSKYPKTYEECCEIIGISRHDVEIDLPQPYQQKMFNLFKLCICRDAYWKIAGEGMGLGEPWEPKFGTCILFSINFYLYNDSFVLHKGEKSSSDNCILVFPTAEIRDIFYENFKDLIEQCKELL